MRILICDDEKAFAEKLKTTAEIILADIRPGCTFDIFTESSSIIEAPDFYDIAFIDIEMPVYNGIDVARRLREINPYLIIFIITAYEHYLDDAMDLNVFRYLKKPLDIRRMKLGLMKALENYDNTNVDIFVSGKNSEIHITTNDILYVETKGRKIRIVTTKGEFSSEKHMDFWTDKLKAKFFYKTHNSYIINFKHMAEYSRDCLKMDNGDIIPIAYRKRTEFRKYFLDYAGGN